MIDKNKTKMAPDAIFRHAIGIWAQVDIDTATEEANSLWSCYSALDNDSYQALLSTEETSDRVKGMIQLTAHLSDEERADLFEEVFSVLATIQSSSESALLERQVLAESEAALAAADPVDAANEAEAMCAAFHNGTLPKLLRSPATSRRVTHIVGLTEVLVEDHRKRVFEALASSSRTRADETQRA